MSSEFNIGNEYSRKDIFNILGLDPHPTGGNWFTGYVSHGDAFYVFTHVGDSGRTGHDYGNRWEGDRLMWFGKTNSRLRHPQTQRLLDPGTTVHIFWRHDNRQPFKYAGEATPVEVKDTSPVEVLWEFSDRSANYEYEDPDEVPSGSYREGAVRQITVNAFERSPAARKVCIDHFGARCQVCGLTFEDKYGDIGRGFIHVHHLVALAVLEGEYEVDPIADLRPVCPNCHAMLHKADPPLDIDELKKRLRS